MERDIEQQIADHIREKAEWCPGSNAAADVPPFGAMPRRWPCPTCGDEIVIQPDGSAAPHVSR